MDEDKANEIQYALIDFFDRKFKAGRAVITMTGTIKLDTEVDFGLWYQLEERLRKNYPEKHTDLKKFLKRYYAGKTPEEVGTDPIKHRPVKSSTEEIIDAINNAEVEYEIEDDEWA